MLFTALIAVALAMFGQPMWRYESQRRLAQACKPRGIDVQLRPVETPWPWRPYCWLRGRPIQRITKIYGGLCDADVQALRDCHVELERFDANRRGEVTDDALACLTGMQALHEVFVEGEHHTITDAGVRSLARIQKLQKLRFDDGRLTTGEGLTSLAELRQLEYLHMFEAKDVVPLCKALSDHPRLHHINLGFVNDEALEAISHIPELDSLWLHGKGITVSGLSHLQQLPKLEHLYLVCDDLDDAAVEILAEIETLKSVNIEFYSWDEPQKSRRESINRLLERRIFNRLKLQVYLKSIEAAEE